MAEIYYHEIDASQALFKNIIIGITGARVSHAARSATQKAEHKIEAVGRGLRSMMPWLT